MNCDRCQQKEGICNDYRPRQDLRGQVTFDYKTPLSCYKAYTVCDSCFGLEDKKFFQKDLKKEKQTLLKVA